MRVSGFAIAKKQPRAAESKWGLFEIEAVSWSVEKGLDIIMSDSRGSISVLFYPPVSFRSQDEGDMIDYWAIRADEGIGVASIYEIEKSEYLEGLTENGVSAASEHLKHWLIAGNNQCVEVITNPDELPYFEETEGFAEK